MLIYIISHYQHNMEKSHRSHHNSADSPGELVLRNSNHKYTRTNTDYPSYEKRIINEESWNRIKTYTLPSLPNECYTKLYDLKNKTYCDLSIDLAIGFIQQISDHTQFLIHFINSNIREVINCTEANYMRQTKYRGLISLASVIHHPKRLLHCKRRR